VPPVAESATLLTVRLAWATLRWPLVRLLRKSGTQVSKRKHECEKLRN